MTILVFAAPELAELQRQLSHPELESAAILLGVAVSLGDSYRVLVREMHVAPENAYTERTPISLTLTADFCLPLEKRARLNGWSLVYVHTHPHQGRHSLQFSHIDDAAEIALASYLDRRGAAAPHAAMIFGKDAVRARRLGAHEEVAVIEVGPELKVAFDPAEELPLERRFDRQVRAFGKEGQARLARMTVAVIGLGGTGSHVVQQLAYLGVGQFILIDSDSIEASNLNRVVSASLQDIGASKVGVARREIERTAPAAKVQEVAGDVTNVSVAREVLAADFIFGCTDNHSSRHVLNQIAYQYRIPYIDMGVAIRVDDVARTSIAGHVKMAAPGLPCLWCANHLDAAAVRRELMTEAQREADPYFSDTVGVPQPAVISINGTIASVAVTMFLASAVGVSSSPRYITYDANRGRMNAMENQRNDSCVFCGKDSTSGWGDTYPLPVRTNG